MGFFYGIGIYGKVMGFEMDMLHYPEVRERIGARGVHIPWMESEGATKRFYQPYDH